MSAIRLVSAFAAALVATTAVMPLTPYLCPGQGDPMACCCGASEPADRAAMDLAGCCEVVPGGVPVPDAAPAVTVAAAQAPPRSPEPVPVALADVATVLPPASLRAPAAPLHVLHRALLI